MKIEHTPGPWVVSGDYIQAEIEAEKENYDEAWICQWGAYSNKANANLIAAAPDLIEALENLAEHVENKDGNFTMRAHFLKEAFAAINKARGKA